MTSLPVPAYGRRSLADLTPALLRAVGARDFPDVIGFEPAARAVLLLVDGLGSLPLHQHERLAPTLAAAAAAEPLTTGFPSTTVASLSSIGTGRPPGEHGMVGFTMALPGCGRAVNMLRWMTTGDDGVDVSAEQPPLQVQPLPTAFELAELQGVHVTTVSGKAYEGTPFTVAALRGGRYVGATSMAEVTARVEQVLLEQGPSFVYAYTPELDMAGHLHGIDSDEWRDRLVAVEKLVTDIASSLPPDTVMVVTGDHGMIDVPEEGRIDIADNPALMNGVRFLGGEARIRHVYVEDGAAADVGATWFHVLGERASVLTRDAAIDAGLFGGSIRDAVRSRIGDVVCIAADRYGVTDRAGEPFTAGFTGHHGALSDAERLVPLTIFRG
jgi:hypothetical protein